MFKNLLTLILVFTIFNNLYATDYYVSVKGNNSNNGLSEQKAFKTLNHALTKAKAGDIIWIKAGNYGNQKVTFPRSGTSSRPIQVIGYKKKPGDIKSTYFKYAKGRNLSTSELPTFNGGSRNSTAIGFTIYKRSYLTIKNIQIQNYKFPISVVVGNNLTFENVLVKNAGGSKVKGVGFRFDNLQNRNIKLKSCIAINCSASGFTIYGNNNLIENCKSYTDEDDGKKAITMDYHVVIAGSNNTVRKHYAEHVGNLSHTGHGISLKSGNYKTENNTIEDSDIVNINGSIEFRHRKVRNNIARNIRIKGKNSTYSGGIHFRDGASNNIVEKSSIDGLKGHNGAFAFYDTSEDGGAKSAAENNIVRNVIITNSDLGIRLGSSSRKIKSHIIKNNKIINCVFYNVSSLVRNFPNATNSNNEIQNSIINKSKEYYFRSTVSKNWKESYNNYYSNGFKVPNGKGNISSNPQFINPSKKDFRLKKGSNSIDRGIKNSLVKKDFYGAARPRGNSQDIGVYEHGSSSSMPPPNDDDDDNSDDDDDDDDSDDNNNKVIANAGKDVRTCTGSKIILTASGGDRYKWSTGETTKSITIYPTATNKETTYKYTVTAYKGKNSDTDAVNVTAKPILKLNLGNDITIKKGKKVTLTSNIKGKRYKWYPGGQTTRSITVTPSKTTTYKLVVKNQNGCNSGDRIKISVSNNKAKINSVSKDNEHVVISDIEDFQIYPNPTSNWVKVNFSNQKKSRYNYQVLDITSKVVKLGILANDNKITLNGLSKGVYFLRIYDEEQSTVKKIIMR